ncbi:uncharacterized protein LACBIDRAFT_327783 [Laccaria bicolor S238N-H82]|uniref:Predicted protein n=1 Tax=Laccaria bicolor (strain S238N-H82 / ATCC MYA-4686) TaxID=486041 RepID=B0DCT9_LACBS|nr:uncharacterized protein LACBIDRAFT_327783 [Laccaria bicolor S238N-H82]EDR07352.1 predicted protein [Laccaria bicolor S238N-H82]|eukprot:XP_001881744.1 predicted protein [Laccaria bicolor S238N-H82]
MPVTFHPSNIPAQSFTKTSRAYSAEGLLAAACPNQRAQCDEILKSSFSETDNGDILPKTNGFVHTVVEAYNNHRCLIIRPDDVWAAILVQLSFYINAHGEKFRSVFVSHEGKKMLTMTNEIIKNVNDPALRDWILPQFTTTPTDTVVFSVLMMATMKTYFTYRFMFGCGLPRVTLEGEKSDWEIILERLERLKEYGLQTIAWYHLLKPVISNFVRAFEDPKGAENLDFWNRICSSKHRGSGASYLAGWVFYYAEVKNRVDLYILKLVNEVDPATLSAEDFFRIYGNAAGAHLSSLVIDGTRYHEVDNKKIPSGFAEVDVLVESMLKCKMTVGLIGLQICSSGDKQKAKSGQRDTVKPVSDEENYSGGKSSLHFFNTCTAVKIKVFDAAYPTRGSSPIFCSASNSNVRSSPNSTINLRQRMRPGNGRQNNTGVHVGLPVLAGHDGKEAGIFRVWEWHFAQLDELHTSSRIVREIFDDLRSMLRGTGLSTAL